MISQSPPAPAVDMDPAEFRQLRDLIRDHVGIFFSDENAYILQRRLLPRLQALRLTRFRDYYQRLAGPAADPAEVERELTEIFEAVAIHETYFFRESYQLDVFRTEVLPRLYKGRMRGRRLSIWSAGCSTGEEAYTAAMEVLESQLFEGWDVGVLGTDLSERALHVARAGRYGGSSFRQTPEPLLTRYFTEVDGRRRVVEDVARLVRFSQANLLRLPPVLPGEPFDVIFFRNVLIYFDRAVRGSVIAALGARLAKGGYLLLGHSENLLDAPSPFVPCHLKREIIYQKPGP